MMRFVKLRVGGKRGVRGGYFELWKGVGKVQEAFIIQLLRSYKKTSRKCWKTSFDVDFLQLV